MFLSTLGIGSWSVHTWVAYASMGIPTTLCSVSRSRPQTNGSTYRFLDYLPKMESHCCGRDSSKLYLEPSFRNLADLYKEYEAYCAGNNLEHASITTVKRRLANKNIAFYKPRKDRCDVCTQFDEGNLSKAEYKVHCDRKNAARKEKKDEELYQTDDNVTVLAVDLQSVLLAPIGNSSAFYYHSKLASYNYTIFDLHSKAATCYFWHEREGTLHADCFALCLVDFLTHNESCQAARKIAVY